MGEIVGGLSPAAGSAGFILYDIASPGVVGPVVTNSFTTLQVPGYYRAQNFRSSNLASFPRSVRKDGAEVKHRLDRLLKRRPNAYQSPTMFWRTLFFHQGHYCNGFAEIERDALGAPAALHVRQPEYVSPFRFIEDDGQVSMWYWVGGKFRHVVAFADMIHLTGLSYDGINGLNPVWLHSETFERTRLMDRYVTRFLVKGSVIRGSVEIPGQVSDDQFNTILNRLRKFKGADANEDVLLLSDGAKLTNNTLSNEQSQLIDLISLGTKQIAQITDVDPYWLFDKTESKYSGDPQQSGEDVVRYLFRPLIEQAEDELLKLLSLDEQENGYTVHIDPGALIRGNVAAETASAINKKNAGITNGNEARAQLGYPPSDDPEAKKLKSLGDTAPAKAKPADEQQQQQQEQKP